MIAEILDRIKGRDVEDIIGDIEQASLNNHLEDEAIRIKENT